MTTSRNLHNLLIILVLFTLQPITYAQSTDSGHISAPSQANDSGDLYTANDQPRGHRSMQPTVQVTNSTITTDLGRSVQQSTKSIYPGQEAVIVIPEAEIDAIAYTTTVEDMKVMAHVLDLSVARSTSGSSRIGGILADYGDFFASSQETESIYLEGYGALFLMTVDVPVS